jgi:medium-chain acyl-[acyl-carrier-protein] hydrolase
VICISRAGGTARDFDSWPAILGEEIELCAVQLPGRLERFREPALSDLREIAAEVTSAIAELEPLTHVLFGDCMGALIAYEVLAELRKRALPMPIALAVGFYPPPDEPRTEPEYADAPAETLRARLREVGGVPAEVLDDDELFELLMPTLRADFAAFENYEYRSQPPFDLHVLVLVGQHDRYVGEADVQGWGRHTVGKFEVRTFPGDHFLLRGNDAAVRLVGELVDVGRKPESGAVQE